MHTADRTATILASCIFRNLSAEVRRAPSQLLPHVSLASPMSRRREIVQAPGAPAAIGPYSHAVPLQASCCSARARSRSTRHRRARGGDARRAGAALPGEPAARSATRPGTSLERALRLTIYMTDLAAFAEVNEVYGASSTTSRRRGWPSASPSCRRAPTSRSTRSSRCRPSSVDRLGAAAARGQQLPQRRALARRRAPAARRPRSLPAPARRCPSACGPRRSARRRWRRRSWGSRRRVT